MSQPRKQSSVTRTVLGTELAMQYADHNPLSYPSGLTKMEYAAIHIAATVAASNEELHPEDISETALTLAGQLMDDLAAWNAAATEVMQES